jgi:hypothetical protein
VPIALPDDTSDLLLVAVDSTGSPVLAAMVTSSSTTLDANSTALALVRIIMATTTGSATVALVNSAIEGSAAYPNLVALIESDLGSNVAPLGDAQVESALLSVATAAQASLPATSKVAGSTRSKQALGNPTMTEEGSFPVIQSTDSNNPYFFITSLASAQAVTAHNAMALPWTAQTFTVNASPSIASTALGPPMIVSAQTLLSGQQIKNLPMTNSPFNFVLTQDQAALNQIAKDFGQNLIESAVTVTLKLNEETCANQVAGFVANVTDISIINGGTFEATEDSLLDALKPNDVATILGECGLSNTVSGAVVYTAIRQTFWKTLSSALGYVTIASDANQIFQEAWYANKEWNETYTVGVCAAQDFSINSCVASFQFYPAKLIMIPGASASVTVTAEDVSGMGTLLPGDLSVSASTPGVAVVTGAAPFNVTASANGTIQVDVLDPATGANNYLSPAQSYNPFSVIGASPTLVPSASTLTVASTDQSFTVSLQGPGGEQVCTAALLEPCLSVPNDVTWTATPTATSVTPITTSGPVGSWTLPASAAAPGTVDVTATAGGRAFGPVTITVVPGEVILTISPSAPSVVVGSTVTLIVSATDGSGNPIAVPPNLQWTSSNNALATVSSGVVSGVSIPQNGVAAPVITVTDPASGTSSTVTVSVTGPNWLGTYQGVLCPGTNAVNPDFQFYVQQQTGAAIIVSNSGDYPVYYSSFSLSSNGMVATWYADDGEIIYTLTLGGNVITLEDDTYTTCQNGNTFTYTGPPPPLTGSPIP